MANNYEIRKLKFSCPLTNGLGTNEDEDFDNLIKNWRYKIRIKGKRSLGELYQLIISVENFVFEFLSSHSLR